MDHFSRLIVRFFAALLACFVLSGGVNNAVARTYEWGTPTGYFPNSMCGHTSTYDTSWSKLSLAMLCELGTSLWVSGTGFHVSLNGGNHVTGNESTVPAALGPYTACMSSIQQNYVTVQIPECPATAVHYSGRSWATCPVGNDEMVWWQTTIASGNLTSGLLPAGSPPVNFCNDGCVVQGDEATGNALIRPGESAAGDDLWVQISTVVTPGLCAPDVLNGTTAAATTPSTACDPLSGACGGTSGGGTGTGTGGPFDESIAGNTSATVAALNKLLSSSDLDISGSYNDCGAAFSCGGDLVRCAQLQSLRNAHCRDSAITSQQSGAMASEGSEMLGETPTALREALSGGSGPLDFSNQFTGARWLSSGACPPALSFTVMGVSHAVGFDAFCTLAPVFSFVLVAGAALVGGRIFAGGLI